MPAPEKPDVLRAVRDEAILTGMVAALHWRVGDLAQRSLDEFHWVVRVVGLTEPKVSQRAKEIVAHLSEDAKVMEKLDREDAAIWSALVHDFDKGMELSKAAMKTAEELRTRIDERKKEVETLISEAGKMRAVRMPPETHLIRPTRWKWMTDFLERAAAGYARDKLKR